jgi:translation elongation factor EF-Ts
MKKITVAYFLILSFFITSITKTYAHGEDPDKDIIEEENKKNQKALENAEQNEKIIKQIIDKMQTGEYAETGLGIKIDLSVLGLPQLFVGCANL